MTVRLVDYSDEDGPDFAVEDDYGEIGRFFSRSEAERFAANRRYVERIGRELFGDDPSRGRDAWNLPL